MLETDANLPVRRYTEVLQFPFCLADKTQAFEAEVQWGKFIEDVTHCLEAASEDWYKLPNWSIGAVDLQGDPLDQDTTGQQRTWTDWQHYQAFAYFHPAVRSFLFGSHTVAAPAQGQASTNDYLTVFRHQKVASLELEIQAKTPFKLNFKVVRCDLLLMQPNVGILQVELCGKALAKDNDRSDETMVCTLGELLTVRDQMRRLYPPYLDEKWENGEHVGYQGGHFPLSMRWLDKNGDELPGSGFQMNAATLNDFWRSTLADDLVPHDVQRGPAMAAPWVYLLKGLINIFKIMPDSDDRLPSMAFVAVDDPRQISRGNWMRLAFADARGDDVMPYARGFLEDFEKRFCYDRFWLDAADSCDWPSRILNSGYAFTFVGSFQNECFFCKPENGAYVAFRQIYVRMGLMVFFQKMALNSTLAHVSWLANGLTTSETSPAKLTTCAKKLYENFLNFTRIYWFIEVSPQVQGVEMFDHWMSQVRNPQIYNEIRQELGDFVMFLDAQANQRQAVQAQRQADEVHRLTRAATVLGGLGVWAGLLGMNIWPMEAGLWNEGPWSWLSFGVSVVVMFICGAAVLLSLICCLGSITVATVMQSLLRCLKGPFSGNKKTR